MLSIDTDCGDRGEAVVAAASIRANGWMGMKRKKCISFFFLRVRLCKMFSLLDISLRML